MEACSQTNQLSDLIADGLYELLNSHNLLSERGIRDYHIRKQYKKLRASKMRTGDAIELILTGYPYLQFDTIRKIIYVPKARKIRKTFIAHQKSVLNL